MAKTQGTPRTWFITGVSSGFGRSVAEAALAAGDTVIGTVRKQAHADAFSALASGRAHALLLDVTDSASITGAVSAAAAVSGRIDVLLNNAGYGFVGAAEEASMEEIRRQFETNYFGLVQVTQAVLPLMRAQGSGRILNMSSGAGVIASPGLAYYASSKFAVEGFSEALAAEVAPLGIGVTIIEPGGFRTQFSGGSFSQAAKRMPEYDATAGRMRMGFEQYHNRQPGDPAKAAQVMLQLVDTPKPPLRLVLGADMLERIRGKLRGVLEETETWSSLSLATEVEPGHG